MGIFVILMSVVLLGLSHFLIRKLFKLNRASAGVWVVRGYILFFTGVGIEYAHTRNAFYFGII